MPSRRPAMYQGWVWSIRWAVPGCTALVVPRTISASARRSGCQTSSTWRAASMTPSASLRAREAPGPSRVATSSATSRATGIGHSVPSLRRIDSQTDSYSARARKPRSGENAPVRSISRSHSWRWLRSHDGQSREARLTSSTRSPSAIRSTSVPPWGSMRWSDVDIDRSSSPAEVVAAHAGPEGEHQGYPKVLPPPSSKCCAPFGEPRRPVRDRGAGPAASSWPPRPCSRR